MKLVITESRDEAGGVTLRLTGAMDLVTREAITDAGMAVVERGEPLTLDLAGVTFIDSTGIGALVELMRAANAQQTGFAVSQRSERVTRIFEATGLEAAFTPA